MEGEETQDTKNTIKVEDNNKTKEPEQKKTVEKPNEEEINNLIKRLPELCALKLNGNDFFAQGSIDKAIEVYKKAKDLITECDKTLSEFRDRFSDEKSNILETHSGLKKFKGEYTKEKISIFSNLALSNQKNNLYEDSIANDIEIITKLDSQYDKSYIRLIKNYLSLNKLDHAMYYYYKMKSLFNKETLEKYSEHLKGIESDPKFAEAMKKSQEAAAPKQSMFSFKNIMMIIGVIYILGSWAWNKYNPSTNIAGPNLNNTVSFTNKEKEIDLEKEDLNLDLEENIEDKEDVKETGTESEAESE